MQNLVAAPDAFLDDPHFGALAKALLEQRAAVIPGVRPVWQLESDAPWRRAADIDPAAIEQMQNAPVAVAVQGALMPDAHVGYGLPIGVLAVDNAVIPMPWVDIACRMMLTVIDSGQ